MKVLLILMLAFVGTAGAQEPTFNLEEVKRECAKAKHIAKYEGPPEIESGACIYYGLLRKHASGETVLSHYVSEIKAEGYTCDSVSYAVACWRLSSLIPCLYFMCDEHANGYVIDVINAAGVMIITPREYVEGWD